MAIELSWEQWCMRCWGRVLTGKYAHCCYQWDDLPIDEDCAEFEYCVCIIKDANGNIIRDPSNPPA